MKIVTIAEAKSMIGKLVKAEGTCGIKDGVTVFGILDRIEDGGAIVNITYGSREYSLPCLVDKNSLELKNGSCDNCGNVICDSQAFNQVCFGCGKKV